MNEKLSHLSLNQHPLLFFSFSLFHHKIGCIKIIFNRKTIRFSRCIMLANIRAIKLPLLVIQYHSCGKVSAIRRFKMFYIGRYLVNIFMREQIGREREKESGSKLTSDCRVSNMSIYDDLIVSTVIDALLTKNKANLW